MNTDPTTSPLAWLLAYGAALLVIGLLDAVWLGWLARDFYRQEIGAMMAESVRVAPAMAFYLLYPAGLVFLASAPTLGETVLRAAVLGLMAYGAYDMSNLATLKGWSARLALVDVAWGVFVSAAAGLAAHLSLQATRGH
jgi:uncharacterized membrane protein